MTFTEAAVQVLRLVGKPLHYKEITDVAIEKDLLSHVGKSPEVTMGARLAAIVKKDPKETQLVRIKPGVFALAEWDAEAVEKGLADRTPALKRIEQREKQGLVPLAESDSEPEPESVASDEQEPAAQAEGTAEAPDKMDDDEIARAELTAAATELFEVEDDDDEPIFGRSHDDEDVIDEEEDDDADSRRRGRRRRRRGRGNERTAGEDDLPTYTVSDASDVVIRTDDDSEASADEPRAREPRRDNRREEGRDERRDNRRDNRRDRDDRRDRPRANGGEPAQVGRELADEVEGWLVAFQRQGGATVQKLAEQAGGRSNGGEHVMAHIVACCRADNLRLEAEGRRPRFRFVSNNRIALSEWALDRELSRLEKDMFAAIDRYRDTLRSRLAKRISELPHKAFTEFAYLVLERAGYKSLSVVKRPGAHTSELHLSGVLAAGGSETPVAIVIRKDGRDIGRERVTELRGSLHHYGVCSLGVLVTAGQILSGARDEAAVVGATPVTFLDGMTIAGLCEQYGIATVTQHLKLAVPDQDLFDAMRHSH